MKHIVNFSFGEASWYAARLVAQAHGTKDLILLFADTKSEDEDTYRWGRHAAAQVGGELVEIADGRDIWQVFKDERFLGNSRVDPCSKILKREMCDRWRQERFSPEECICYFGIALFESERADKIRERLKPYKAEFPLLGPPYPSPKDIRAEALACGLGVQRMYELGFSHANCAGQCVKAGIKQWKHLLSVWPDKYKEAEAKEQEIRDLLGKDVSILTDRRGGVRKPMPLRVLREEIEAGKECEGVAPAVEGCSCFST